ncbi:NAD(P)-dependent oxidoreductase [Saccharopolyspora sp. K220]|uniref:NAD(P)-dependent oxidoreductase n=1 Tax=Saccharopolyspora soli TaxID=2926618 RepID=UPI001F576C47|nr:NAD(P)-dependent oxidoreductase [Saccharopolyspora soli]MCI2421005.1 NAD(P)-dependent oxidoreductase [Saccharopolyspora soli]
MENDDDGGSSDVVPTVGVIGLGAMGLPIAGHLARSGIAVTVHDLDPDRADAAAAFGCAVADGAAVVAEASAVTFVLVPSDSDVRAVCLDAGGVVDRAGTDGVIVVCSSVHPATVREIDAAVAGTNGRRRVLDAALTGGVRAAEEGAVNLLVGGPAETLERARPVLEPWCATVHHLGELGAGQIAKSANNLVHWAQICAIEEALDLARRYGLSVPAVRAALMDGPTDSRTLRELERMRLTWWAKDLDTVDRLAREVGRPTPVADLCRSRMSGITVDALAELLVSVGAESPALFRSGNEG